MFLRIAEAARRLVYIWAARRTPPSETNKHKHTPVKRTLEVLAFLAICALLTVTALGFCGFFD